MNPHKVTDAGSKVDIGSYEHQAIYGLPSQFNPHSVTRLLEIALQSYTGAPFVSCVNSCTMALELALLWQRYLNHESYPVYLTIPSRTYVSVPQSIVRAGFEVDYVDYPWEGEYQLNPLPVWDSAKRFTSGMYRKGQFQCVSFHVAKIFGDTQGGAILHDDPEAQGFFREARFDGRTAVVPLRKERISLPAEYTRHCYMSPDVAVRLLNHFQYLPEKNEDQKEAYADISYIR
jgi:dTDP-4-amino-4,6-dideoxygalactose transaminase